MTKTNVKRENCELDRQEQRENVKETNKRDTQNKRNVKKKENVQTSSLYSGTSLHYVFFEKPTLIKRVIFIIFKRCT